MVHTGSISVFRRLSILAVNILTRLGLGPGEIQPHGQQTIRILAERKVGNMRFQVNSRIIGYSRAVLTVFVLIAGVFITACNGGHSSIVLDLPNNCTTGFAFAPSPNLASGSTPILAVSNFLFKGSVSAAPNQRLSPLSFGFPSAGWHKLHGSRSKFTFGSGYDKLRVIRVGPNRWQVVSGVICEGESHWV